MNHSESIKELAGALCKAQGDMQNPKFDTQNPFFKSVYASLASVRNTVIPVFSKHGLSVIQSLRSTEKGVECETMLMHISGEWVADTLSLPITKHDAQGYGSAATYARRYSLMSFAGVVGDSDDDANAATDNDKKQRKEKPAGSGSASPDATPSPAATGAASETRTETLRRLCNDAHMAVKDILAKAEAQSAEEMSDDDYASALRMLKKKIASLKAPA